MSGTDAGLDRPAQIPGLQQWPQTKRKRGVEDRVWKQCTERENSRKGIADRRGSLDPSWQTPETQTQSDPRKPNSV